MRRGEEAGERRRDERAAERDGPSRSVVRNHDVLFRQSTQGPLVVVKRPAGSQEGRRGSRARERRRGDAAEAERRFGDNKGFISFFSFSLSFLFADFLRFEPHGETRGNDRDIVIPAARLLESLDKVERAAAAAAAERRRRRSVGFVSSSRRGSSNVNNAAVAAPPREADPHEHLVGAQVNFSITPEKLGRGDAPGGENWRGGRRAPLSAVAVAVAMSLLRFLKTRDVKKGPAGDEDGVEVRCRGRRRDVPAHHGRAAHGPPGEPAQLGSDRGGRAGRRGRRGLRRLEQVLEGSAGADRDSAAAFAGFVGAVFAFLFPFSSSSSSPSEIEHGQLRHAPHVDANGVPHPLLRALDPDLRVPADEGAGGASAEEVRGGAQAEQGAQRRRAVPLNAIFAARRKKAELGFGPSQELSREERRGVYQWRRRRRGSGRRLFSSSFFAVGPRRGSKARFPLLSSSSSFFRLSRLSSLVEERPEGVDDRPVARAAAEVAAEHLLDVLCWLFLEGGRKRRRGRRRRSGAEPCSAAAPASAVLVLLLLSPHGVSRQTGMRRHHEPGGTKPALRAVGARQGGGQRVEAAFLSSSSAFPVVFALKPLDSHDRGALGSVEREEARVDRPRPDPAVVVPVHERHSAGAASAFAADELGAREAEVISQILQQSRVAASRGQ